MIVDSLAAEHGWPWLVDVLIEEVKTAPGEDLAAVGDLVEALMATLQARKNQSQPPPS